jgi:M6 family metalloprotease-like protein
VGIDDPSRAGLEPGIIAAPEFRELSAKTIARPGGVDAPILNVPPLGTVKNLVVMVRFSNHVSRPLPSAADMDVLFNAVGGDPSIAPTGSVRDVYFENSYGQMTLDSDVNPGINDWITVSNTEAYYANGQSGDSTLWQALREALDVLDTVVDFNDYDTDNNGRIDSIAFIHSGYGAEWGGTDAYGTPNTSRIWSHRWAIQPQWNSNDGVSVFDYHISPGVWGTSGSAIGRIGVIAHETGHFFGLPDLYDTQGSGSGIGSWGLMANSWDFNFTQLCPPHFSPWSKVDLGWYAPTTISQSGQYNLNQAETNPEVYRIDSGYPSQEYLLIENRQNAGFDCTIPQGGLVIWHIDDSTGYNTEGYPGQAGWPQNGNHYRVAVLQADGDYDLEREINRGDAGDTYHAAGIDAIGPGPGNHPNTDAYKNGNIIVTGHTISDVSASGSSMTFCLNGCGAVSAAQLTRGPYLQMQTDDGMTIRWRTDIATDSVVRYGTSVGNLNNTATVAGSRTEHEVVLSGLGTAQQFWYSVGDSVSAIAGAGDTSYNFKTAPTQGVAADTRVWVIGDSGTANADARAVRDAYKTYSSSDPADFWIMLGDNAYNDGTDAEYQAAVFDTYPEILRQLPLWSTLGNHDGHSADSATQSGPYYDIFNLPANGEVGGLPSGTEAYYSFDYANIHFICLESYETDRSVSGNMMTWLESDLATNTQPWVIAFWHHPPYTKGSHNSDTEGQLIDMRENALPILEAWGVDLVLSGHSHSYERSYLLDGHYGTSGTLDPVANVLNPGDGWVLGDGAYQKPDSIAAANDGAVYAVAGSSGKISGGSLNHPAMFFSLNSLGSMVIDVAGGQMEVVFIDETGTVEDIFNIYKTPDTDPPLLSAATAEDATHVLVDFSEALDSVEAQIAANYSIAGLSISSAVLQPNNRSVHDARTKLHTVCEQRRGRGPEPDRTKQPDQLHVL